MLSQHTASSRGGSGLGILIAKRSTKIRHASMFARVVASAVIVAEAAGTAAMLLMKEPCRCTSPSTRLEHVLASSLASLLCTFALVMFMHYSLGLVCARTCVHACGRCSIVYGISFVNAT